MEPFRTIVMKNAIILHGIYDEEDYFSNEKLSPSNMHWTPWLQKKLLVKGYNCQTPEVFNSYQANYSDWLNAVKIHTINEETVIIAHSAGSGFFLKYLSEDKTLRAKKLILVAPFIDPFKIFNDFLQTNLDKDLNNRIQEIHIFFAKNEYIEGIRETVKILRDLYPNIYYHEFDEGGHFSHEDMGTIEFPKLLEVIES